MATSNISDDKAPKNFHLNEDSQLSISSTIKCPLCLNQQKVFYCRECVCNGDFIHSKHHWSERFAEKKVKWYNQKAIIKNIETKCAHQMQRRFLAETLRTRARLKQERIILLRKMITDTEVRLKDDKKYLSAIALKNRELRGTFKKYADKVTELEDYVINKSNILEKKWLNHEILQDQLKLCIRNSISKLTNYIFPIEKTTIELSSVPSTAQALADATRTAYVRGRWILQDSLGEEQQVIVGPSLPGNGDYSAYNEWVTSNRDGVPSTGEKETNLNQNHAYRISAALTFTAQLVQLLAYYLNVILPFKINYSDFCGNYMSEQQFSRKVARLNANIVYLCYTQHVKLHEIHPKHTLENIQTLLKLEFSDLGRMGYFDSTNTLTRYMESQLREGLDDNDSESEDENNIPCEWETVPHLSKLDEATTPSLPSSVNNNPIQSSMAGGLAASIVSFWRGWTAGK